MCGSHMNRHSPRLAALRGDGRASERGAGSGLTRGFDGGFGLLGYRAFVTGLSSEQLAHYKELLSPSLSIRNR